MECNLLDLQMSPLRRFPEDTVCILWYFSIQLYIDQLRRLCSVLYLPHSGTFQGSMEGKMPCQLCPGGNRLDMPRTSLLSCFLGRSPVSTVCTLWLDYIWNCLGTPLADMESIRSRCRFDSDRGLSRSRESRLVSWRTFHVLRQVDHWYLSSQP